jgi:hypothetical protein
VKQVQLSKKRGKSDQMYVIREAGSSYVKVGITNNIERRLRTLQTANPHKLELVYKFTAAPGVIKSFEKIVHRELKKMDRHVHGEWFFIHPGELKNVLEATGVLVFTNGGRA